MTQPRDELLHAVPYALSDTGRDGFENRPVHAGLGDHDVFYNELRAVPRGDGAQRRGER